MNEENKIEDIVEETVGKIEDISEEVIEESTALVKKSEKIKKHIEAKKLVDEAKSIVATSDNEMQDCKLLLEDDLREYEVAKQSLKTGGLDDVKELLAELGNIDILSEDLEDEGITFEAKDGVKPIVLKDVHSGRFTGFLFSLIGGAASLGGLVYWATEKLDMTMYLDKIPSNETAQNIFGWFGSQVGRADDAISGGILVATIVLLVMILIYALRVWLKGGSNLRFANEQMREIQKYITHKSNCKVEMDRVDVHITDAINVLKDYEVVLNEQKGKLKRVLHFEGQKENFSEYQIKSTEMMKDTESLIENVGRFIMTPMSEEGKLSDKSTLFLHSAKENLEKVLAKLY